MRTRTLLPIAGVIIAVVALAVLSGRWIDTAIWGADGARVIDTTRQLIRAASSGDQAALACEHFATDFGDPQAWNGLRAGEPEKFDAATSLDRSSLDASWSINLEGSSETSDVSPSLVFYREIEDGLCVADVRW
ncbi:hypothetical protein ESZ53_08485 [Salinibacterium sp. UTAS2018]|uniref:hypothetical protein n=1 Tax=Salinibacterium sp. UTAS2018 TaxID=2508880 RepID=UPI0010096B28|nr:hypothetical protein [Salinibacterium sp. UTAS2018]QAV70474.1 hypothetical protein ESZ53_08485 [Salinibacterium sp. UTAS2018]